MLSMDIADPREAVGGWGDAPPDGGSRGHETAKDPLPGAGAGGLGAVQAAADACDAGARPSAGVVRALHGGAAHGVHIYEASDPALVRSADDPDMLTVTAAGALAHRDPKSLKDWEGRRINRYRVLSNGRELRRYSRTEILIVASALPGWVPPQPAGDPAPSAAPLIEGDRGPGAASRAEGAALADAEPARGEATDLVRSIQEHALRLDLPLRVQVLATARQLGELRDQAARLACQVEQLQAQVLELARTADIDVVDRAGLRARLHEALALLGGGA